MIRGEFILCATTGCAMRASMPDSAPSGHATTRSRPGTTTPPPALLSNERMMAESQKSDIQSEKTQEIYG